MIPVRAGASRHLEDPKCQFSRHTVRFGLTEVQEVESWKKETKAMHFEEVHAASAFLAFALDAPEDAAAELLKLALPRAIWEPSSVTSFLFSSCQ